MRSASCCGVHTWCVGLTGGADSAMSKQERGKVYILVGHVQEGLLDGEEAMMRVEESEWCLDLG